VLTQVSKNHVAIVKDRKSRIIMKDGETILEQAGMIQEKSPGVQVSLKTSAPVCSKTRAFLTENGIDVMEL